MTTRKRVWRLQMAWQQAEKNLRGDMYGSQFAGGARIIEGTKDMARERARRMLDELIATNADGSVFNCEVHVSLGVISADGSGFAPLGSEFLIKAGERVELSFPDVPTNAAALRRVLARTGSLFALGSDLGGEK